MHCGWPHFSFHPTTAYAILRHGGVEIGKKDDVGSYGLAGATTRLDCISKAQFLITEFHCCV